MKVDEFNGDVKFRAS